MAEHERAHARANVDPEAAQDFHIPIDYAPPHVSGGFLQLALVVFGGATTAIAGIRIITAAFLQRRLAGEFAGQGDFLDATQPLRDFAKPLENAAPT